MTCLQCWGHIFEDFYSLFTLKFIYIPVKKLQFRVLQAKRGMACLWCLRMSARVCPRSVLRLRPHHDAHATTEDEAITSRNLTVLILFLCPAPSMEKTSTVKFRGVFVTCPFTSSIETFSAGTPS